MKPQISTGDFSPRRRRGRGGSQSTVSGSELGYSEASLLGRSEVESKLWLMKIEGNGLCGLDE